MWTIIQIPHAIQSMNLKNTFLLIMLTTRCTYQSHDTKSKQIDTYFLLGLTPRGSCLFHCPLITYFYCSSIFPCSSDSLTLEKGTVSQNSQTMEQCNVNDVTSSSNIVYTTMTSKTMLQYQGQLHVLQWFKKYIIFQILFAIINQDVYRLNS